MPGWRAPRRSLGGVARLTPISRPFALEVRLDPGSLPLHQFCCLVDATGILNPSDTQRGFRLNAEVRAAAPRRTGSPALRRALLSTCHAHYPGEQSCGLGRLLLQDPTAFPVRMAGRRSRRPFRGLLGLHSHCGPSTRRPTRGGPMFRELQRFGSPPRRLGSYLDVPTISRTGLDRLRPRARQMVERARS
jgi:hypothetical protein